MTDKQYARLVLICCFAVIAVIALVIVVNNAANLIAERIPQFLNATVHNVSQGVAPADPPEFMNEHQAASFFSLWPEDFVALVNSGELAGTYTTFQVERRVWPTPMTPVVTGETAVQIMPPVPILDDYEIVIEDRRIFSRDLLAEWLVARIANN